MIAPRHRVLAIYACWNALMQFEWLRFAPITDATAAQYGISASDVGLLSLLFPLLFLPLALPTGRLIDRWSLRALLNLAAAAMVAGVVLRLIPNSFHALVAGQLVLAAAQPLVVSLISKLVTVWFPEADRLRATSIGTMSLLLGPALAFVLIPPSAGLPMYWTLVADAVLIALLAAATFLLIPADPQAARGVESERWLAEIGGLLRNRGYLLLLALVFIGNGYASAIFTWLEPMLQPQQISADAAGLVALLILAGGLVGMAVAPKIPDIYTRLRPLLITLLPTAAALTLLLVAGLPFAALCAAAFLLGLCVQGPLPLIVDLVTEAAGIERAGTAASGFWLSANAGAAALIALLSLFADAKAWHGGAMAMAICLLAQAAFAMAFIRHRERVIQSR